VTFVEASRRTVICRLFPFCLSERVTNRRCSFNPVDPLIFPSSSKELIANDVFYRDVDIIMTNPLHNGFNKINAENGLKA
jgi:hypothetical protein